MRKSVILISACAVLCFFSCKKKDKDEDDKKGKDKIELSSEVSDSIKRDSAKLSMRELDVKDSVAVAPEAAAPAAEKAEPAKVRENQKMSNVEDLKESSVVVAYEPEPARNQSRKEEIFSAVEQMPEFPGGQSALMTWLSKNINYPQTALENGIQGRVAVKFVVEKDGSVSNVVVVKSVDSDLDREAVRVVKKMPKWMPGKNNGYAVRCYYTLPVTFRIQD